MLKVLLDQVLKVLLGQVLKVLWVLRVLEVQAECKVLKVHQELYLLLEQECYSNKHQHQVVGLKILVLAIIEHCDL